MSYPSRTYHTRIRNEKLLPYTRIEAISMNFRYYFFKVWLEIPKLIKRKGSYPTFEKALTEHIYPNTDIYFEHVKVVDKYLHKLSVLCLRYIERIYMTLAVIVL